MRSIGICGVAQSKHAEIDGVFDYAKGWVENKLESLVGELQES